MYCTSPALPTVGQVLLPPARMLSQIAFTQMVNVQSETIERYIRDGKIIPDMEVPVGEHRSFKFFQKSTVEKYAKALASAIGEIIGAYPSYQAAPSFAYIIGEYTLDRNGVLTGPRNSQLLLTLDQDGYRTK